MSVLPRLTRQAFRDGPHRRFAVTVAHRIGPIENIADALSHAARRLRLLEPDPDQHVPNHRPRDAVHLHIAAMGKGIGFETALPLRGVLLVAPCAAHFLEHPRGGLPKGGDDFAPRTLGDRIEPHVDLVARITGFFARIREGHDGSAAETNVPACAVPLNTANPAFRSARLDDEVETAAVAVATRTKG